MTATETELRDYNVAFDGDLRITVRVRGKALESLADYSALAAMWVKKALTEVNLGPVPVGGIDDEYTFSIEITEATLNDDPELFEVNGQEVHDDEDGFCPTCGEVYTGYGDGWDGECPDCADKTYASEFPEEFE